MTQSPVGSGPVPKQALLLSLLSLWVPVLSSALFPDWTSEDVGVLVWLLALIPGFLLSYYRGWRGASVALAAGMAAIALAQVIVVATHAPLPATQTLMGVVAVLTVVSLGSGLLSTLFHQALNRAERMALTDSGTGLPNRRHAILELERAFAAAQRGMPLSVILFDLDHFKRVNDKYGHAVGDRVLAEVAGILMSTTRTMNVTARFGGEEFIAINRGGGSEGAYIWAERVRERVSQLALSCGPITVSAGISEYEEGMASHEVVVAAADQALYRAKNGGRNQVVVLGKQGRRPDPDDSPAEDDAESVPVGHGELVLVVDDDPDALQSVARALRRFGYTVLESASPVAAVDIARGLDEPLDLVLTDIVMPEMGGFRLVEMVGEVQPDVRVIYMSGYTQEDVDWGGVPGAAREYLSKPISIYTLARRVRRVLDRPASGGGVVSGRGTGGSSTSEGPRPLVPPTSPNYPILEESSIAIVPSSSERGEFLTRKIQSMGVGTVQAIGPGTADVQDSGWLAADLLVLDLDLARDDLVELLTALEGSGLSAPGVALLVGARNQDLQRRVLDLPVADCLREPISDLELEVRIRNLLRMRSDQ